MTKSLALLALVLFLFAPPVSAYSPNGSRVPDLPSLVDNWGSTWTLGPGGQVLRDGVGVAGFAGSRILFFEGRVYAYGYDGQWWRCEGDRWANYGTVSPAPQSPEGATTPPRSSVVDNWDNIWTVGADGTIYHSGVASPGIRGSQVILAGQRIYGYWNGWWYRAENNFWSPYGTVSPSSTAEAPPPPPAVTKTGAIAADAFVDSIGVNTHFAVDGTTYVERWETVRDLLLASGIRHIREGIVGGYQPFFDRLYALYTLGGVRLLALVGWYSDIPGALDEAQDRMPQIEAFEGINEWDQRGDPNWVQPLRDYQRSVYQAVKSSPRRASFPVLAPAMGSPEGPALLGDISAWLDFGNLHNYYAGRNPGTGGWGGGGYGSLNWNMARVSQVSGSRPMWSTETGYGTGYLQTNLSPDPVNARYFPRLLLTQFGTGIRRTYLYQFADEYDWGYGDGFSTYGLVHGNGTPKPAYYAVKNLIATLNDPGPAFTPGNLDYTVSSIPDLKQMLLQKRDGTFYLAVWREVQDYEPIDGSFANVAPLPLTVTFTDGSPRTVTRITFDDAGAVATEGLGRSGQITTSVSSHLTILQIR